MATTIRGNLGRKEKRGTSPSSSLTKKSPKPLSQNKSSASSSSLPAKEKILLKKPATNYLKSTTMSSTLDSTSKRSTTDLAQKPSHPIRRRSFDRPPPTSEVQRAIRSRPETREVKPSRSTSFSQRLGSSSLSPSSSRVASDPTYARTTSSLNKDGTLDSNFSKSQSRKKSIVSPITPVLKKGMNGFKPASSTKKASKSVTSESSNDYDDNPMIDQLGLEDDLVSMDIESQSLPEMSEMLDNNQELGDPITVIDGDIKLVEDLQENFTASEEQDLTLFEGHTNQVNTIDKQPEEHREETNMIVEQQHPAVEERHSTVEEERPTVEERHPTHEEKIMSVEEKHLIVEEHNQIVEEQNVIIVEQPVTVEEQKPTPEEQNPIVEQHNFLEKYDEDDKVVKNVEHDITELVNEKKEEAPVLKDENVNVKRQILESSKAQTCAWRKDKQAYNDVIEETASKLMGGKRNKVLALAGAFETVISLQDTAKK